jgi:hypothetical protein
MCSQSYRALGAVTAVIAVFAAAGMPVAAHHSITAVYFVDEQVTIRGTVLEFDFHNPHTMIYVSESADNRSSPTTWAVEWAAPGMLARENVSKSTIKAGDQIIIVGNPARDRSNQLRLREIVRPADGWKWMGSSRPAKSYAPLSGSGF